MNEIIALYEELSMNAHPALQTLLYDGWVLRFSNGYTNRANSVNPIYPSELSMEEKVSVCERTYEKQNLPIVFKLTNASPDGLDSYSHLVSQAVHGRGTQNGAVVNEVYTPPHYRNRGYASSVAAELSRIVPERGNKFCCLFAGAENPIPCGIYRITGYYDLCVFDEINFNG